MSLPIHNGIIMNNKSRATFILFLFALQCDAMEMDASKEKTLSTVSYIYYPSQLTNKYCNAKLEVEGHSWSLLCGKSFEKPLEKMIYNSQKGGEPFFQFVFEANSNQVEKIKKSIVNKELGLTCSSSVLYPLSKAGVCSVPLPIKFSPLLSALYLGLGKIIKYNNVKEIKYYGNPSLQESVNKMLKGPLRECLMLFMIYGIFSRFLMLIN